MVSIIPAREDLRPGFSAPPAVFHVMGLAPGDVVTNKYGTDLVVRAGEGDEWTVVHRDGSSV